jgi:hypothetical protein
MVPAVPSQGRLTPDFLTHFRIHKYPQPILHVNLRCTSPE